MYFRVQLTSLLFALNIRHGDDHVAKLFGVLYSTNVEKAEASVPQLIRTWVMQLIKDTARSDWKMWWMVSTMRMTLLLRFA
jgi:hypothetical protein